jgi:hypothetical protein
MSFYFQSDTIKVTVRSYKGLLTAKLIQTPKMPIQKGKLTMWKIYSNITCWRYFLCRKQNETLLFYNEAKKIANKYLSAEHLLYCLIEYERLKSLEAKEKCNSCHPIGLFINSDAKIAYEINQNHNEKSINEDLSFNNI